MKTLLSVLTLSVSLTAASAFAQMPTTPSVPNAKVYFISPKDGETIKGPVKVVMGLSGMGIAPAGVDFAATGHHHLLVNLKDKPVMDMPLPVSDNYRHFGKGQTETSLDLAPGTHTLQLLLGDNFHIPHNPPVMSEKITITVTK